MKVYVNVFAPVMVASAGSVSQAPPVYPELAFMPVGTLAGLAPLCTVSVLSVVVSSDQVPFTTL